MYHLPSPRTYHPPYCSPPCWIQPTWRCCHVTRRPECKAGDIGLWACLIRLVRLLEHTLLGATLAHMLCLTSGGMHLRRVFFIARTDFSLLGSRLGVLGESTTMLWDFSCLAQQYGDSTLAGTSGLPLCHRSEQRADDNARLLSTTFESGCGCWVHTAPTKQKKITYCLLQKKVQTYYHFMHEEGGQIEITWIVWRQMGEKSSHDWATRPSIRFIWHLTDGRGFRGHVGLLIPRSNQLCLL